VENAKESHYASSKKQKKWNLNKVSRIYDLLTAVCDVNDENIVLMHMSVPNLSPQFVTGTTV
jgi:hypothetical protein